MALSVEAETRNDRSPRQAPAVPRAWQAHTGTVLPLLGGSWDIVTTYNWAYNPTYNPLNDLIGVIPIISGVITPVINSY